MSSFDSIKCLVSDRKSMLFLFTSSISAIFAVGKKVALGPNQNTAQSLVSEQVIVAHTKWAISQKYHGNSEGTS